MQRAKETPRNPLIHMLWFLQDRARVMRMVADNKKISPALLQFIHSYQCITTLMQYCHFQDLFNFMMTNKTIYQAVRNTCGRSFVATQTCGDPQQVCQRCGAMIICNVYPAFSNGQRSTLTIRRDVVEVFFLQFFGKWRKKSSNIGGALHVSIAVIAFSAAMVLLVFTFADVGCRSECNLNRT